MRYPGAHHKHMFFSLKLMPGFGVMKLSVRFLSDKCVQDVDLEVGYHGMQIICSNLGKIVGL